MDLQILMEIIVPPLAFVITFVVVYRLVMNVQAFLKARYQWWTL